MKNTTSEADISTTSVGRVIFIIKGFLSLTFLVLIFSVAGVGIFAMARIYQQSENLLLTAIALMAGTFLTGAALGSVFYGYGRSCDLLDDRKILVHYLITGVRNRLMKSKALFAWNEFSDRRKWQKAFNRRQRLEKIKAWSEISEPEELPPVPTSLFG